MKNNACLSALLFVLSFSPGLAWATLGERAAVAKHTVTHEKFQTHESQQSDYRLKEYTDASGTVFAVSWKGYSHPKLAPLLGRFAGEYHRMQSVPRQLGRRQRRLASKDLVVHTWGHPRHLQGLAYVPNLLPAGVNANELK